jgi:hypothetical protein
MERMMSPLIPALQSELAALESDMRQNPDPRIRKAERIRELLREYGQPVVLPMQAMTPMERAVAGSNTNLLSLLTNPPPHIAGRQVSKQERIRKEIHSLLEKQQIAHRKDILAHLTSIGVMGHEKDPMQALAAYLSGFKDEFVFDGNGNYSLRPS